MIKKILVWLIALLAVAALAGAAYYYFGMPGMPGPAGSLPPAAMPDNNVIAGPVAAISADSITIAKQDGAQATLGISPDTQIVAAGENGQPGMQKSAGDIREGMMVLATPSGSDASAAAFIVILPPPPAQ